MVIAIDFDGTVVEHDFPNIGEIKPHAKEVINKLYDQGHQIVFWTCRSNACTDGRKDLDEMREWLKENNIKYHKINENSEVVTYGCKPKIYYDILIDDRSLIFTEDWELTYRLVQDKIKRSLK